jgi:glucose-1-phosphate adenylyltransferase
VVTESILSTGSIIAGGSVDHTVLSPGVRILRGAEVVNSVILDGTVVGAGAVVRNAILDKNIVVPPGAEIGVDPAADRARGFTISADGITVLGKGQRLPD